MMYMFRHRGERIQPGMANSMSKFFFKCFLIFDRLVVLGGGRADVCSLQDICIEIRKRGET